MIMISVYILERSITRSPQQLRADTVQPTVE